MSAIRLIGLLALLVQGFRLLAPCYCFTDTSTHGAPVGQSHDCCSTGQATPTSLRSECCCDDRELGDAPAAFSPVVSQTPVAQVATLAEPPALPTPQPVTALRPERESRPDCLLPGFRPNLRGPPC